MRLDLYQEETANIRVDPVNEWATSGRYLFIVAFLLEPFQSGEGRG